MLKKLLTVLMIVVQDVVPLLFTPQYAVIQDLALEAVKFIQASMADSADADKRAAALEHLTNALQTAGITATNHLMSKAIEFAVGKLKRLS